MLYGARGHLYFGMILDAWQVTAVSHPVGAGGRLQGDRTETCRVQHRIQLVNDAWSGDNANHRPGKATQDRSYADIPSWL